MYYCLVCKDCKKQLSVFRNGNYFDADPNELMKFILDHQSHGIILLDEHKADSLCYDNRLSDEWKILESKNKEKIINNEK